MKRGFWSAILLLGACDSAPDLFLPLRAPTRIVQERPTTGSTGPPVPLRIWKLHPPEPPVSPLEWISPLQYERGRSRLSESDIEWVFRDLLKRRHASYDFGHQQTCGWRDVWLVESSSDATLEAWIFSDLYPEQLPRLALEVLRDQEAHVLDVFFVLLLLQRRDLNLTPDVEQELIRLTDYEQEWIANSALYILGTGVRASRHRGLLRTLCSKGVSLAFDLLSLQSDPESKEFLAALVKAELPREPRLQGIPFWAGEALKRMAILDSPHWRSRIELLLQMEDDLTGRPEWAESIAFERMPHRILAVHQQRIDRVRAAMAETLSSIPAEEWMTNPRFFADYWRRSGIFIRELGREYDLTLIDFAMLGGRLNVWEARRLEHFGFLGDRETRLKELLKERRRW
jgi:hypothetical protein